MHPTVMISLFSWSTCKKRKISILYILLYTYVNAVTIGVICFQLNWYFVMVYVSVKDTKEGNRDWESVANRTDLITSNCHIHVKTYKVLKVQ